MATIQRPVKTYGNRNYAGEVASAPNNTDPILANEVDGDLDTIYAAWNGGTDTVNIKDGSVTEAKLATDAHLWTIAGATIKPFDPTKTVAVLGGAAGAGTASILLGSNTGKARIQSLNTTAAPWIALTTNRDAVTNAQDDSSKPSWQLTINSNGDNTIIGRAAPGVTTPTSLLTLDNAGSITTPSQASTGAIICGSGGGAATTRILAGGGYAVNYYFSGGWQRDDTSKSGWYVSGDSVNDQLIIYRAAPVGGAQTSPLKVTGVGDLTIVGSNATKATGTTWINPSDPRLKQDVAPYAAGLAEIAQLEPITYRLKAQPDGPMCYGFDAEKVRAVFPECVTSTRMKLDPTDEEETEDVLVFDMHPILIALVNAVRELAGKVAA